MTNQFEYHPYLNQRLLIDECRRLGVSATTYCGMAVGRVFDDPVLLGVADRRAKTVAQIVLRWLIQQEDGAFSCMDGACGSCKVQALEGMPDHRDMVLGAEEHAANRSMLVCCSRALSERPVLDL